MNNCLKYVSKPEKKKMLIKLLLLENIDNEVTIIEHFYKKKIHDMYLARKNEGFYSILMKNICLKIKIIFQIKL